MSATQSWTAQNAVSGSLQPLPGASSAAWRQQQVPQDEPFPLRKTLSVPAYFRSPSLHSHSHIPKVCKDMKKSSPPPTAPLLVHESPASMTPAYSNALTSFPDRQINLSQWPPFASGSRSETSSTSNLWSTKPDSLSLKRSYSSGPSLSSPVGKQETQTRQGMSPKCLSLPPMSPGSKQVGRYGTVPVPRPLLPTVPGKI